MQRTLKRAVRLAGVGLHSGRRAALELRPSPADSGIVFVSGSAPSAGVAASIANVDAATSQLCSQLRASQSDWKVSTIEHLMAALVAARITNAQVQLTAEDEDDDAQERSWPASTAELPILDGSSRDFVTSILEAGIETQTGSELGYIKILRPVQVLQRDRAAWLLPMPETLSGASTAGEAPVLDVSVHVNFHPKGLGSRSCRFVLDADPDANLAAFAREIAPARTFTFEEEIAWMRSHGLALGGSLDNAVVFAKPSTDGAKDIRVLNEQGLRFPDEWARHKLLDCIGDIGLAGKPLHGIFVATSPGHALTHELLRELFSDPLNYEECR